MKRTLLLLAALLTASPASADRLLTEISNTYRPSSSQTNLVGFAWEWYAASGMSWSTDNNLVGVVQSKTIPKFPQVTLDLSSYYRTVDFSVSDPLGVGHTFLLHNNSETPTYRSTLASLNLFKSGTYGTPTILSDGFTVNSHYTPPNGNSFQGTDMRFTRADFLIHEWTPGLSLGPRGVFSFTVSLYGVPEPASGVLFVVAMAGFAGLPLRRR